MSGGASPGGPRPAFRAATQQGPRCVTLVAVNPAIGLLHSVQFIMSAPVIRNALNLTSMVFALSACGPAPDKSAESAHEVDRLQPVQHPDKAEVSPEESRAISSAA